MFWVALNNYCYKNITWTAVNEYRCVLFDKNLLNIATFTIMGTINIPLLTVGVILTFFGVIGNVATIIAFIFDKQLRIKPSDFIILNLAISDLGMSALVTPWLLISLSIFGRWPLAEIGCRIFCMAELTFIASGILFVILISLDRLQMLSLDYSKYVKRWNTRRVFQIIALTWCVALSPGIFEIATWDMIYFSLPNNTRPNFNVLCLRPTSWRPDTNVICFLFVAVIPTALVAILGMLIFINLRRRLKKWRRVGYGGSSVADTAVDNQPATANQENHANVSGSEKREDQLAATNANSETVNANHGGQRAENKVDNSVINKRYIKPIVTYFCLVICLVICTFPISLYQVVISSTCPECMSFNTLIYLVALLYFNACLNPMMYSLTNSKIRDFYRRQMNSVLKLCCKWHYSGKCKSHTVIQWY